MGLLGQFMAWKYPNIFGKNTVQQQAPALPVPDEQITPAQLGSLTAPWSVTPYPMTEEQMEKNLPINLQEEYYPVNSAKPSFMRRIGNQVENIIPLHKRFTRKKED